MQRLHDYNEGSRAELEQELKWLVRDKCFKGLVHMGHGGQQGGGEAGEWYLGDMKGRTRDQWFLPRDLAGIGHRLDFVASTGCTAWHRMWLRFVSAESDFSAPAHVVAWPKSNTTGEVSGPSVGTDVVGLIKRKAPKSR